MQKKFDINPYIGVGDLRLGMNQNEVAKILGKPDDVEEEADQERREYRIENGLQTVYSKNDELVEIGFSPNISGLSFKDTKLFENDPLEVLHSLVKEDKKPYELYGFVVLLNLGVTLTGFLDASKDDRAVTVFVKGRWDSLKMKMKLFKF